MPIYPDQTGHSINLTAIPKRIISVVPSQTELLFDIGLDEEVIGITKFCVHPEQWFRTKKRVGGTKQLNIDIINSLKPDLIIANKEENTREEISLLQSKYHVWTSDIGHLNDALCMIYDIGSITGKEENGIKIIQEIGTGFEKLIPLQKTRTAAYLIWQRPYMVAGGDTFIHDMMHRVGLENIFRSKKRYPETSIDEIKKLNPELILLSSEPFPFKEKHLEEISALIPGTKVLLVDGEMFSWYGSRLLKAVDYLQELVYEIEK